MNWTTAQATAALRRAGVTDALPQACGEPRRAKYGAVPTVVDGIRFASKAEARSYLVLTLMKKCGDITDLKLQPRYELQAKLVTPYERIRAVNYVGDFEFVRDGLRVCVDVKGIQTQAFAIKWKLVKAKYPEIQFELWK